ncbi:IclR family transcriptional regulator [Arthrobacter crystallopoietes]|uniref:IclR family transcriptional regulator n=1 Tax=Crystallibacter crystallopoietes TaxID=37928 RepID=UPI0014872804|nr:IclR family transcriptional regulator C-terminal domain-containing protein [Arthrobacter crystallopoietes]
MDPQLQRILETGEDGSAILSRGLALLHLVSFNSGISIRGLSEESGIPLATTYRVVGQLAAAGFVVEHEGQIHAGTRMAPAAISETPHLVEYARPPLRMAAMKSGLTAVLTVRVHTLALCLDVAAPRGAPSASFRIGETRPLYAGGSATPLLAFAKADVITRVLSGSLKRYTAQTPDETTLREKLERVRTLGYDITRGEVQPLWTGIGLPVLQNGEPICCLSLVGPSSGIGATEPFVELLREAAAELAASLPGGDRPYLWNPTDLSTEDSS